jgi:hypothetical protein
MKCWHVVLFAACVAIVLHSTSAGADTGSPSVDTTTGVVTSGGALGAAGFLWMMLRKVDAFFDRISRHFQAEEQALSKIASYIDRWELREEVRRENSQPIDVR